MENYIEVIIYLVIGAFWLLSRIGGRKKKPQPKARPKQNRTLQPQQKPKTQDQTKPVTSLEDILKEITGQLEEAGEQVQEIPEVVKAEVKPKFEIQKPSDTPLLDAERKSLEGIEEARLKARRDENASKYKQNVKKPEIKDAVEGIVKNFDLKRAIIYRAILERPYK